MKNSINFFRLHIWTQKAIISTQKSSWQLEFNFHRSAVVFGIFFVCHNGKYFFEHTPWTMLYLPTRHSRIIGRFCTQNDWNNRHSWLNHTFRKREREKNTTNRDWFFSINDYKVHSDSLYRWNNFAWLIPTRGTFRSLVHRVQLHYKIQL